MAKANNPPVRSMLLKEHATSTWSRIPTLFRLRRDKPAVNASAPTHPRLYHVQGVAYGQPAPMIRSRHLVICLAGNWIRRDPDFVYNSYKRIKKQITFGFLFNIANMSLAFYLYKRTIPLPGI